MKLTRIKDQSLAEIFQALDIKFAFVNEKYEEVSTPAKCRDFLGDCVWSRKTGNKAAIYSFHYSFKDKPYDVETTRLSLRFPDEDSLVNFRNNLHLLHEKEQQAGVPLTEVFETEFKNTIVVEASPVWQQSSWKLSLYTFYIKRYSYINDEALKSPENGYINDLTPKNEAILLKQLVPLEEEHLFTGIGEQHNYTGFISIIKGTYNEIQHQLVFGG